MNKFLNKAQADAIYRAMVELNNINARLDVYVDRIHVWETFHGAVVVTRSDSSGSMEQYKSQADFAEAYNL